MLPSWEQAKQPEWSNESNSNILFFPYTDLYTYNFSLVNHLLETSAELLSEGRSKSFVVDISSTFVSRTRVFSSFLYRLFNNSAYKALITKYLYFILLHFGNILLHFGNILLHFGKSDFYFTTLWQIFYYTLASPIFLLAFQLFIHIKTLFTFNLKGCFKLIKILEFSNYHLNDCITVI